MHHGKFSKQIAKGLIALRKRIDAAKIPSSKLDETLNIATWNIREFGKSPRTEAAIHYIAEILGQFDLIGIVELRDNLEDLSLVLKILGPYWRAVYSDMIPDHGSNLQKNKRYDQILHYPNYPENFTNAGGVLNFFIDAAHIKQLFPAGLSKDAFTFQMSDHLPLWMQISTDIDGQKLEELIQD